MSRTIRGIQGVLPIMLAVSLAVGVSGCWSGDGDEGESDQEMRPATTGQLVGRDFVSEGIQVPGGSDKSRYRISFSRASDVPGKSALGFRGGKTNGASFAARTGCISIDGLYLIRDGRMKTPFSMITGVGCGRAQERFDSRFQRLIASHPKVRFDGETLLVTGRKQTIRLTESRQASETGRTDLQAQ